jgi:beta-glucanase (GH16 family)
MNRNRGSVQRLNLGYLILYAREPSFQDRLNEIQIALLSAAITTWAASTNSAHEASAMKHLHPQFPLLSLLIPVALSGCSHPAATLSPAKSATRSDPDAYQLVWHDEFNTPGPLNPADWSFEKGFVRNEELQWYQPQNAICLDGRLIIEARREHLANPNYNPAASNWKSARSAAEYTSASVTTQGKHAWLYGRFEMKAKIDTRAGSWPAFWTLGTTGRWPAGGEVDIMEFYKNTLLANVAWQGDNRQSRWHTVKTPIATFGPNWSDQFHIWRMDWDEKQIVLSCDGRILNTTDLKQTVNAMPPNDNPFHHPMYLLLNQAIGGQGGDPAQTSFPLRYEIEYVRVYQKPSQMRAQAATTVPAK